MRPFAGNGREAPLDGPLASASLDQPSGITTDAQKLYFADSEAREAQFHEPGDVSMAAGKLYVADTNNHAILVADLETGQVSTLELRGL